MRPKFIGCKKKQSKMQRVDDILVIFETFDETFEKTDEDILDNVEDEKVC